MWSAAVAPIKINFGMCVRLQCNACVRVSGWSIIVAAETAIRSPRLAARARAPTTTSRHAAALRAKSNNTRHGFSHKWVWIVAPLARIRVSVATKTARAACVMHARACVCVDTIVSPAGSGPLAALCVFHTMRVFTCASLNGSRQCIYGICAALRLVQVDVFVAVSVCMCVCECVVSHRAYLPAILQPKVFVLIKHIIQQNKHTIRGLHIGFITHICSLE